MKQRTEQEKIKLLSKDWDMVEGWSMDYERPEQAQNVVISIDEITKRLKEGTEKFFIEKKYGEWFCDLDDAWDSFLDNIYNELDTESDDVVDAYLDKILEQEEVERK